MYIDVQIYSISMCKLSNYIISLSKSIISWYNSSGNTEKQKATIYPIGSMYGIDLHLPLTNKSQANVQVNNIPFSPWIRRFASDKAASEPVAPGKLYILEVGVWPQKNGKLLILF